MRRLLSAVGVVAFAATVSGCWLQPGFDDGRSNHNPDETKLTSATVGGLTELWATDVGPGSLNAPISRAGTIYLTAHNRAAAVRASTGQMLWLNDQVFEDLGFTVNEIRAPLYHEDQVVAPAVERYPGSGPGQGTLVHLDPATGAVAGRTSSGLAFEVARANGSLAVREGNGGFYAGGFFEWISWTLPRKPVFGAGLTEPLLVGEFAIVGDRILWSHDNDATGFSENCPAIPSSDEYCNPDWATDLGARPGRPVAIGTDQVAYSAGSKVFVLDVTDGEVLWTADVGGGLAVADGTLFVTDADQDRLVALPADGCGSATCAPLWEADVADLGGRPTVGGDVVYVRTDTGDLQAFGRDGCGSATCTPLATVVTEHPLNGDLVVSDGRIIATTSDGQVVAFGLPAS